MPDEIRQELLTAAEVRQMLGMEATTFREFLKANPLFPKPKAIGKNRGGSDMMRYLRKQVEAYLELMGG